MAEKVSKYTKRNNLTKRGKVWYCRISLDGKDVWRAAGRDRNAAQEFLGKLRGEAERGQLGLSKSARGVPTLAVFADKFMAWSKAHKDSWKRDTYSLKRLLPVFGPLKLTAITKARVADYQQARLASAKGPTINREVACLTKILSYAVDMRVIDRSNLVRVQMLPEAPGRIPVLEPADEGKLLEHGPAWFRLMVRLAAVTGCRQGELLALRWRHVDIGQAQMTVENSKDGESRRVPLHPAILPVLDAARGDPDAFLFLTRKKTPPSRSSVTDEFKKACTKIGRPELRFHDLRHVAGSRLLATGASLPEVASMLGHKTLVMSQRYSHVSPVRLAGLIANMVVAAPPTPEPQEPAKVIDINRKAS